MQGGRRGVFSRRTWPSSHAIRISRSQIVSSRCAISIADNFRSRTEASRFRSIPSSSEIVASKDAIRASRCSSHSSRWATAWKSFWSEREQQRHSFALPLLKFPIVRPKLFGL